ncbi:MAG: hypothetical protein ABIY70_11490 [Capsulimonas sp.]|uniref:hypothetical protein n=1 Tax=Capsulimonas sp. TaxID=2494211 RepID=UPI0032630B24
MSGTGTVMHHAFEGGFYAIDGDDGQHYDPTNLSPAFQQDNLRVKYRIQKLPNNTSTHQYGYVVEVLEINNLTAN